MSISHVSPTISKLLPLLIPGPTKTPGNEPWETLAKGDPNFLAELRREGLTPLIFMQLLSQGRIKAVNPTLLSAFEHDYYCSVQAAARQEQEALPVFQALNEAGVEFILLKGADLRLRVYPDPAQRPMADLDILISPRQLWQAKAVISNLGYRLYPHALDPRPGYRQRFGHALDFNPEEGRCLAVDLHWRILAAGDFYRLSYGSLSPKAVSLDFQGSAVWLLAPEHLLLHLCLRVYNDRFSLFFFIDLALAISKLNLDWSLFLQETSKLHCQRPTYLILLNLSRLFPWAVPGWVLDELAKYHPRWYERVALSYRMRYLTLNFPMLYHNYPPREWAAYYWGKLWPEPAYLAATYGKPDRIAYLRKFLTILFCSDKI